MAEEKVLPMSPEFGRWYRAVDMGDDQERLQRRWHGVSNLVKQFDGLTTETMIALAFRTKRPIAESVNKVRQAFKAADENFQLQQNDRELEILCGASLAALFDQGSAAAAYAALAVTTASLGGARKPDLPIDLVGLAERTIAAIAEKRRKRPNLSAARDAKAPQVSFEESSETVKQKWNAEGVAEAFGSAAEAADAAVAELTAQFRFVVRSVSSFVAIQDEELQMLWWLFGARSSDLDCSFNRIPADAQPFVLAAELAKMTTILPGPASAKAMLSRAGVKEGEDITVPDAVNGCDAAWLEALLKASEPSPVTQPLHFAIRRKLETGDATAWVANWAAVAGIDAQRSLPRLSLATYFYRERLLSEFGD